MGAECAESGDRTWADPYRLETTRLSIDPCDAAAAQALAGMVSDPRVAEPYYLGPTSSAPPVGVREGWYQSASAWRRSARFNWAVRARASAQLVGCVQFRATHVSYFVGPAYWHQGYGDEMVNACCQHLPQRLGLSVWQAVVVRENMASRRILERAGFAFSGLAQQPRTGRAGAVTVLHYQRVCAGPATGA